VNHRERKRVFLKQPKTALTKAAHCAESLRHFNPVVREWVQVTIEDPGVFEKPWHMNMNWDLAPNEELIEYVCENNQAQNMVGK
jgi:hypothetical protein